MKKMKQYMALLLATSMLLGNVANTKISTYAEEIPSTEESVSSEQELDESTQSSDAVDTEIATESTITTEATETTEEPDTSVEEEKTLSEELQVLYSSEDIAKLVAAKYNEDTKWMQKLDKENYLAFYEALYKYAVLDALSVAALDMLYTDMDETEEILNISEDEILQIQQKYMLPEPLDGNDSQPTDDNNKIKINVKYVGADLPDTFPGFEYQIVTSQTEPKSLYSGKYTICYTEDNSIVRTTPADAKEGVISIENSIAAKKEFSIELDSSNKTTDTYTISEKENKNGDLYLFSNVNQTVGKDNVQKDASFNYVESTDVTLTKKWNDGRVDHSSEKDHYLQNHVRLKCKIGDGSWINLESVDEWSQIGLINMPVIQEENITLSEWTYCAKNLPKTTFDTTPLPITYGFYENTAPCNDNNCIISNYLVSQSDSSPTIITNTLKNTFEATIQWKDQGNADKRPGANEISDFIQKLTIHPSVGTDIVNSESVNLTDYISIEKDTENTDIWTIRIHDLPAYDANGTLIDYSIIEPSEEYSTQNGEHWKYSHDYKNIGSYGSFDNALYNGGTVVNTLQYTTQVSFHMIWEDGNCDWIRNGALYLYRYPDDGTNSIQTASGVQGYDVLYVYNGKIYYDENHTNEVNLTDGSYLWGNAADPKGTKLEKYSPTGATYVYFIKQKLAESDYSDTYYKGNGTSEPLYLDSSHKPTTVIGAPFKYILNGGTVKNTLSTIKTVSIEKKWVAKEISSQLENVKVTIELQKRYAISYDTAHNATFSEWTYCANAELNGFSAEVSNMEYEFSNCFGYTSQEVVLNKETDQETTIPIGSKIEYQVIETGIIIGDAEYRFGTDDVITIAGEGPDGTDLIIRKSNLNDTITNTVVSKTQVKVSKIWSKNGTKVSWPEGAIVKVKLHREDGNTIVDADGKTVNNPVITLDSNNQTQYFSNLPRFNDDGSEIVYYVEETSDSTLCGYSLSGIDYNKSSEESKVAVEGKNSITIRQTNAQITNTIGGSGSYIRVSKQWLDDGDLTLRTPIIVGIYKKTEIENAFNTDGSLKIDKAVNTSVLNDGNAWTQKISLPSGISKDDCIALEINIGGTLDSKAKTITGGAAVKYTTDVSQINSANATLASIANGNVSKIGSTALATQSTIDNEPKQLYNVFIGQSTSMGETGYVIYNQRYGNVSLKMSKSWINGGKEMGGSLFKVWKTVNGDKTPVAVPNANIPTGLKDSKIQLTSEGSDSYIVPDDTKNIFYLPYGNEKNIQNWELTNLPKYDSLGRLISYSIEEIGIIDKNNNIWWNEKDTFTAFLDTNKTVVESEKNKHTYDTYISNIPKDNDNWEIKGNKDQHTGDVYAWAATNTRQQSFNITIRKIWRDDGTNNTQNILVSRPDIYFRLYYIPVGTTVDGKTVNTETDLLNCNINNLINASSSQGQDYTWDTKHNEWHWTCDIEGTFPRYAGDGREYLYYAVEHFSSTDHNHYVTSYYNGEILPNAVSNPNNTVEAFNPNDYSTKKSTTLLVVHKEGDGIQSNGTVVNTKEFQFTSEVKKIWMDLPENFDKTTLPTVTMELQRKLKTDTNEANWETVATKDITSNQNIVTQSFNQIERYDEYGRYYDFKTEEKNFVVATDGNYGKDNSGNYTTNSKEWKAGTTRYNIIDKIPGYKTQAITNNNAFTWTNTYDPDAASEQRVEIKVDKTWIYPIYADALPEQTFQLWRRGGGLKKEELVSESKITITQEMMNTATNTSTDTSTDTSSSKNSKQLSINFKFESVDDNTSGKAKLPYYGANGEPYTYYVKEIVPGGYLAKVSGGKNSTNTIGDVQGDGQKDTVIISNDINLQHQNTEQISKNNTTVTRTVYSNVSSTTPSDSSTTFTNTYNGKPGKEVEATKIWDDLNDKFGTRPDNVTFTLYRKDGGIEEAQKLLTSSSDTASSWTKSTNTWTWKAINSQYVSDGYENNYYWDTYGPDGTAYTYYVTESPSAADSDSAKETTKFNNYTQTLNGLEIKNTLKTTKITAKKIWKSETTGETPVTSREYQNNEADNKDLEQLFELGAMPNKITFILQYLDDGGK